MDIIKLIGFLAAFLTTIATIPQAVKIIKSKKTEDLSLIMYITLVNGVVLWLIYGILMKDYPLIIANSITLIITSIILILILKYKK